MSNKPAKVSNKDTINFTNLDLKSAETTVKWMEKVGLEEIELEQNDVKIRLKRPSANMVAAAPAATQPASAPATPSADKSAAAKNTFKAPIVGTFYRSASPEGAPFVNVGDTVKAGQTICIIEAMKTMNQVEADKPGTIKQVLVDNAQPVEFGDPLFVIE